MRHNLILSHIRVRCPWHRDRSQSLVVSFRREFAYCMTCGVQASLDVVAERLRTAAPDSAGVVASARKLWDDDEHAEDGLLRRHFASVKRRAQHGKGR